MEKSTKLDTTKAITRLVVGRCVSGIVYTMCRNNVTAETKTKKVLIFVGAQVLGNMVAESASDYTDRKIDELAERWEKIKNGKYNQHVTE